MAQHSVPRPDPADASAPSRRTIRQQVTVRFDYPVHFTRGLFAHDDPTFRDALGPAPAQRPHRMVVVVDDGVHRAHPGLESRLRAYVAAHDDLDLAGLRVVPGGEASKNDPSLVETIHEAVFELGLDRHGYVVAIGGGAVLDMVGYAAATAHRGIRHVRVPTTVLSQNDSGVGVKNSVNRFDTKNFLGTFAPPFAVLNDADFLTTLDDRDWRGGLSEAVKVALLEDPDLFDQIDAHADALRERDAARMDEVIFRCAELHLDHIASGGDAFEAGSSRPLDFGHWSAHRLEALSGYRLRHGEAVAIGIALDATYSQLCGLLSEADWRRILSVFHRLGLATSAPELVAYLDTPDHPRCVLRGLEEFREHLGGELTVMLLEGIGRPVEVHHMDLELVARAARKLQKLDLAEPPVASSTCSDSPALTPDRTSWTT